MKQLLFCSVLFALSVSGTSADAQSLTERQRTLLAQAEAHLNGLSTIQSQFVQVSSNGGQATGRFFMERPSKLRIDYDDPTPILLVTSGTYLAYVDREIEEVTWLKVEDTPAAFLLRNEVKLGGDKLDVLGVEEFNNRLHISLARKDEDLSGSITLVFRKNPMSLHKWSVTDPQGIATEFALLNPFFGGNLDPTLFEYESKPEDSDRN